MCVSISKLCLFLIYIPIVTYHHGCFGTWISVLKDDQECIFWKWEMHQSAKVYQRARGTKEINDTIGLTQIGYSSAHHFFSSLSFLFFSFSLYSWQSIIICKKSSLLYNLLNQVSWDQINLSITKFYSGLKILKKTWTVIEEYDLGHVTDKSWRSLFFFLFRAYTSLMLQ